MLALRDRTREARGLGWKDALPATAASQEGATTAQRPPDGHSDAGVILSTRTQSTQSAVMLSTASHLFNIYER